VKSLSPCKSRRNHQADYAEISSGKISRRAVLRKISLSGFCLPMLRITGESELHSQSMETTPGGTMVSNRICPWPSATGGGKPCGRPEKIPLASRYHSTSLRIQRRPEHGGIQLLQSRPGASGQGVARLDLLLSSPAKRPAASSWTITQRL
jgi:hypothetical protein